MLSSIAAVGMAIASLLGLNRTAASGIGKIGRVHAVRIDKRARWLCLKRGGATGAQLRIALGFESPGQKAEEGYGRTPEGRYVLDWRNPDNRFHCSLHVSYRNAADTAQAAARNASAGGDIFLHGTLWWLASLLAVLRDQVAEAARLDGAQGNVVGVGEELAV